MVSCIICYVVLQFNHTFKTMYNATWQNYNTGSTDSNIAWRSYIIYFTTSSLTLTHTVSPLLGTDKCFYIFKNFVLLFFNFFLKLLLSNVSYIHLTITVNCFFVVISGLHEQTIKTSPHQNRSLSKNVKRCEVVNLQ